MPSCTLNDSSFWHILQLWAATLYWGIYTKTSLCICLDCGFVLTWSLHKHDWREDGKTSRVRKERDQEDMLSSFRCLQTVWSFSQGTVTVKVLVFKGKTVVKWLLLPHIFTCFALRKSLLLTIYVDGCKNTNCCSASLLRCRKGSLLQPTRSDQCTGHLALGGCIVLSSTVIIWR